MKHYRTLTDFFRTLGTTLPENPMISLVTCTGDCSMGDERYTSDFYTIGFKKIKSGEILYGRTRYDHDGGSMYFTKPRQMIEYRNVMMEDDGFVITFHEDFLNGHPLHDQIKKYGYFEYETAEALHLSPKEEQIMWDLFRKIEEEYHNNTDEYSKDIMLTHIDSVLHYAQRFYKRQFINRMELSGNTVSRFNEALAGYFAKGEGLPTVGAMAAQLNLSTRYLSDLLKQETGKTAMEIIHIYLVGEAKNRLRADDHSISEIAYGLGFENLPYFSRLFKKVVGVSPNQYKKSTAA